MMNCPECNLGSDECSCINNQSVTDSRIAYCVKLWLSELKTIEKPDAQIIFAIMTLENEIVNGSYCSDEEFNNYIMTGKIIHEGK